MELVQDYGINSYRRNRYNPISGTYNENRFVHNRANSEIMKNPARRFQSSEINHLQRATPSQPIVLQPIRLAKKVPRYNTNDPINGVSTDWRYKSVDLGHNQEIWKSVSPTPIDAPPFMPGLRLSKTKPKDLIKDPITGDIRRIALNQSPIQSLGTSTPGLNHSLEQFGRESSQASLLPLSYNSAIESPQLKPSRMRISITPQPVAPQRTHSNMNLQEKAKRISPFSNLNMQAKHFGSRAARALRRSHRPAYNKITC